MIFYMCTKIDLGFFHAISTRDIEKELAILYMLSVNKFRLLKYLENWLFYRRINYYARSFRSCYLVVFFFW